MMDGWTNQLTGLGTSRDKRQSGTIKNPINSSSGKFFEALYHGDDMAAKIAETAPKEMVREWIDFTVQQGDGDDEDSSMRIETPLEARKVNDFVMSELDRLKAKTRVREAMTWARVFGGSLLFLGVDDGTDPEDVNGLAEPLDESKIKSFDFLTVFDRFDVVIDEVESDPASERVGLPKTYRINNHGETGRGTNLGSRVIHASRFIRFDGALTTRRRIQENGGWRDSIYVKIDEVLRDFGTTWASVAHLMQDFSQGIYGLKDLAEVIAANQGDLVLDRLQLLDKARAVGRAIPIDKENESFDRNTVPLTGLPDTLIQFALRLSAAANTPVVLLMGMSPAGFSATGESDLTFWYNEVRAGQEDVLRDPVHRLIELVFATGETKEPEQWSFDFNPLWSLDDKEESEVRKNNAISDNAYIDTDVLTPEEVAQSRFGGDKYGTDIVLDAKQRATDLEADKLMAERIAKGEIQPPTPPVPPVPGQPQPEPEPEPIDDPVLDGAVVKMDKIEKRGTKWVVLSSEGKVLGTHATRAAALKQLDAVEASKARASK